MSHELASALVLAQAAPDGGGGGGVLGLLLPMGALFLIMYAIIIRPQQRQQKEHREMVAAVERGDQVVTSGGIHGKVTGLSDDVLTIEIADRVKIKVDRSAVVRRTPSQAAKAAKDSGKKTAEAKS